MIASIGTPCERTGWSDRASGFSHGSSTSFRLFWAQCANDRIVVSETAVIDGDLAAPAVRMADGAKVQGRIDTGDRKLRP